MDVLTYQVCVIRAVYLVVQVLVTSFLPPYDTSAIETRPAQAYPLDFLGTYGHSNWDAVYYNHLAQEGYSYEKFGAFFPLYPAILSYLSRLVGWSGLLSPSVAVVVVSVVMNNLLFITNSKLIYRLSKSMGGSDKQSYQAALLFSFNPASVFMSVGYTESLFCFLVLWGLIKREEESPLYFIFFTLATAVRANGLTLLFFYWYDHGILIIKTRQIIVVNMVCLVIQTISTVAPFIYFQKYFTELYCEQTIKSVWCGSGLPYSYIQQHYWGNGLFKYWRLDQLPNFLLALPIFLLVLLILTDWLRDYIKNQRDQKFPVFSDAGYLHIAVLSVLALCTMHVQVTTRFLLANCPVIVVYCVRCKRWRLWCVVVYFVVYSVVGLVLHSTFYPWT